MAHELNLTLVRLNCYIRHPELGTISKTDLGALAQAVRNLLPIYLPMDGTTTKLANCENGQESRQWLSGAARN